MNKLVKGSVAAAAGIVLLMGGAGSLALWNDSADLTGGSIDTGELSIVSNGDGAWATGIALWVPEDTDTYTETFDITASGDNILAEVEAIYTAVSTEGVTADATVTIAGLTPDVNGVFTLDEGTYDATVVIDAEFDADGLDNQNATVPLGDVQVTLQQIIP